MTNKILDETEQAFRLAALLANTRQCSVCGRPFTLAEWVGRHEAHRDGCSRDECDCDYPVHADCCPECNPEIKVRL